VFRSIQGFSRVGWYNGNGAAQGPFVHCGFRPAFLLIKTINAATNWMMYDSARSTVNPATHTVLANNTIAEVATGNDIDFCATGFTIRSAAAPINSGSNTPHIFLAMAVRPAKYANAG
jgi:hypothetical protein